MIVALVFCAALAILWLHAEIGWADAVFEHEQAERRIVRLRERNQRLAEYLWAEGHPRAVRVTRIVADSDQAAIEALIAECNREGV